MPRGRGRGGGRGRGRSQQTELKRSFLTVDLPPNGTDYSDLINQLSGCSSETDDSRSAPSVSDDRTAMPDLGPDLLHNVFVKLGPSPKDLAPLGAVCREWRSVTKELTWKELCWKHGRGLLQELGYHETTGVPPGGWLGLFKLLTYCPGLHFPTFKHVLQSNLLCGGCAQTDAPANNPGYSWRDGAGHVEEEPENFLKGPGARDGVYLASRFKRDQVVRSHLCGHAPAVAHCSGSFEDLPPLGACRGIVKNFASSTLARVTGAAAYLREEKNGSGAQSTAEALKCPYCDGLCFPLEENDFALVLSDYRDLLGSARWGMMWGYDSDEDSDRLIVTGFVCISGHIVLQLAGYPRREADELPLSGENLKIVRSSAARYWGGHLTGKISYLDGQRFIASLGLSELISVGDRLDKLQRSYPTEMHQSGVRQYKVFGAPERYHVVPKALQPDIPGTIVLVLQRGLPFELFKCVHKHVLEGEPSLAEFLAKLSEGLKIRDDNVAMGIKAERTERIHRALLKAGFTLDAVPHQQSVDRYIQARVPNAITIKEVILEQRIEQEPDREKKAQMRRQFEGDLNALSASDYERYDKSSSASEDDSASMGDDSEEDSDSGTEERSGSESEATSSDGLPKHSYLYWTKGGDEEP